MSVLFLKRALDLEQCGLDRVLDLNDVYPARPLSLHARKRRGGSLRARARAREHSLESSSRVCAGDHVARARDLPNLVCLPIYERVCERACARRRRRGRVRSLPRLLRDGGGVHAHDRIDARRESARVYSRDEAHMAKGVLGRFFSFCFFLVVFLGDPPSFSTKKRARRRRRAFRVLGRKKERKNENGKIKF